jgi:hypothetical protein
MRLHLVRVYGDLLQFFQSVAEIFTKSGGSMLTYVSWQLQGSNADLRQKYGQLLQL